MRDGQLASAIAALAQYISLWMCDSCICMNAHLIPIQRLSCSPLDCCWAFVIHFHVHTRKKWVNNGPDEPKTFAFWSWPLMLDKRPFFTWFNERIICYALHCDEVKMNYRWLKAQSISPRRPNVLFFFNNNSLFFWIVRCSSWLCLCAQVISALIIIRIRLHSHAHNKRTTKFHQFGMDLRREKLETLFIISYYEHCS